MWLHVMGVGEVGPSRTLPAEQDVKSVSDTVAVEELRLIAPPFCMTMPPPECEPRRVEEPGAKEGPRATVGSPIKRTHPSVRSARQSILHQWRGRCSAVSAVRI